MARAKPTALLVDMDGVLRRWDPAVPAAIESEYGLPGGALLDTAMAWHRLRPAITGEITDAEWASDVASYLEAPTAVAKWQQYRGELDQDVLAFVREVRALGVPVGLAANATDRLDADLDLLGLTGSFDVVVNSSVVGAHKPAKQFFAAACAALRTAPDRVLLIDDSDRSVRGARVAGLLAYRWTDAADLKYLRASLVECP